MIADADRQHLTGDAKFDYLVDRALHLPTHRMPAERSGAESPLRPEFARLFEKFRIGKTQYQLGSVKVAVRRCGDCHVIEDGGMKTGRAFITDFRDLTGGIARAQRILLAAHRGGVEVGQARAELDSAVDNEIELETLVHAFAVPGEAQKKYEEGSQHAKAALITAQHSLDELNYRRKGLAIALAFIILVLAALALKIRTI